MAQKPPQPPEMNRKIQIPVWQLIGILLIVAIPVLALSGVFGSSTDKASASGEAIEIEVNYPTRYRYKMLAPLEVSITNTSSEILSNIRVHFEREYIDRFSEVKFTPSVEQITDEAYEIVIDELQPGETRLVTAEIQAEKYGQHSGSISVQTDGAEPVEISVKTFVFP